MQLQITAILLLEPSLHCNSYGARFITITHSISEFGLFESHAQNDINTSVNDYYYKTANPSYYL